MEEKFWLEKWNINSIGFHRSEFHPELMRYLDKFEELDKTIMVPLCGKTLDMIYLKEQDFNITGIEFSAKACEDFFNENKIPFEVKEKSDFRVFQSESITLYCGDYFKFEPEEKLNFAYDRAAFVAIDPETRQKYAQKYADCINPEGKLLMLTFEYDQSKCQGPPWSTEEYFVYEYFEKNFDIELLEAKDLEMGNPRMREAGVCDVVQKIFLLTRKV